MANIQLSFSLGEIIIAGQPLIIKASTPVSPKSAQGAVFVRRDGKLVRSIIELDDECCSIKVPTKGLELGKYELMIGELLDQKGKTLNQSTHLSIVIGSLSGKIGAEIRIDHIIHLSVGEFRTTRLKPGCHAEAGCQYLELVKGTHRNKLAPQTFAFDEKGQTLDGEKLLIDVQRRHFAKYGRLHESLHNHLAAVKDDESIEIIVYPKIEIDLAGYSKPSRGEIKDCPAEQTRRVDDFLAQNYQHVKVLEELGAKAQRVSDTVAFRAVLTKAQINDLTHSDRVGSIHLDDKTSFNDLSNSIAVAHSDRVQGAGFDGTGVKVAVFEDGPSDLTNLAVAASYLSSPAASDHSRLTHAIIKNTETAQPHGHAPGCDLYSANSSDNAALTWACQQGCTVISQSFHRGSEPGGADLQSDDLLKDMLALQYPFPFIAQAAGNYWLGDPDNISPPESEFVNHKGYNTISVGNHDDTATSIDGSSCFNNPTSTHGDRELPEISANGTAVTALGQTMTGTSFAAPATAGVAALMQQINPTLKSWPEGMRAILFASAKRNVSGGTWWADVASRTDASDGAGALDADSARSIAQTRVFRNNSPTARGWDVGTIVDSDFDADTKMATFRYWITVPRTGSSDTPETVRACIAWDSKVVSQSGLATQSTLTVDLDLWVRDTSGNLVGSSSSFDNSYEIVEFTGYQGQTYEIVVRKWSGTDQVWYGVAWQSAYYLTRGASVGIV